MQSKRCSALGVVLYRYFEHHGSYPDDLKQLVTSGFISGAEYGKMMFQPTRRAEPIEWRYRNPGTTHNYLLISGKPVRTWIWPHESYVVGGVGGSAIVFGKEKLATLWKHYSRGDR